MSTAEILAQLPKLKARDRAEVFQKLCALQERDLIKGAGPTPKERKLLDQALKEFQKDSDVGIPWRKAIKQIRSGKKQ
jgi:hypothetical protein